MQDALLRIRDIRKTFPGVVALNGVQLEVGRGEVHALLGENGAGKSTVLKILAGAQPPDPGQGTMEFDGQPLDPADTPMRRQQIGIVTIYQEFNSIARDVGRREHVSRTRAVAQWVDRLGTHVPRRPVDHRWPRT